MLNMYLITLIMLLSVFGIYFLVKEAASLFLKNDSCSRIIIDLSENENETENMLRSVLYANPKSEIIILDKCENPEVKKILEKFSSGNSRIHIKTAPEK